jgi:hypothetical protein
MMDQALQNYFFGGGDKNFAVTAVLVDAMADKMSKQFDSTKM